MSEQLNKLQIKAEVLTVLSQLQANLDAANVDKVLSNLIEQKDKKSILNVLIKELIKANEQKAILICFLLLKLCEKKEIEEELWDALKNPAVPDSTKAIILNILKDMGNKVEYEKLEEYFENPNEVIDADTKRLLQSAIINPEAQIDFLDFLNSLVDKDKKMLIQSLGDDYTSDSLANIINPLVLYSPDTEIGHISIEILGQTKSQLALHALSEALKFVDDEETIALIKKNISTLKIAGVREDNAIEFYKNLLESKPYFSYASYPDGHGNQAIIFSRIRKEDDGSIKDSLQMFTNVINDTYGLIDCFGFNDIKITEFERIVSRFYNNDSQISLNPSVIKTILLDAEKLTRSIGGRISYEYICWKNLLSDIEPEATPIEVILKSEYNQKSLSNKDLEQIFMLDFIQKWFFDTDYSDEFKNLISNLNSKFGENNFNIDPEDAIEAYLDKIFTSAQKDVLDKRILMSTYLKYLSKENANNNEEAALLYSLYFDENSKTKLAENIIRKSIYEYYVMLKFKYKEEHKMTNIFAMRNKQKDFELTEKQINSAISLIEKQWVK